MYVIQGMAESHLANLDQGIYSTAEEIATKSRQIFTKTTEQTHRALDIMKRFAVFAKTNVGQEIQIERIDLNEILENVLPLVGHELELDKIKLIKNIPSELPPIQADRRHIEEILFNLIVNACQAMKSKGGRIEIAARECGKFVKVIIEDNGPGISSEQLKHIFEPFYTTKDEGTGLGLYVVKQLIERNGGKIFVKSGPGYGTYFNLEFSGASKSV